MNSPRSVLRFHAALAPSPSANLGFCAAVCAALSLQPLAALAQDQGPEAFPPTIFEVDEQVAFQNTARRETMEAARFGDLESVQQRVAVTVNSSRTTRPVDVDTAEELAGVSFNLQESGETQAAESVGGLAREVLGRLQRSKKTEEVVWAGLMEAALWERVHRDSINARAAYQRVLQRDPQNVSAREGVARLDLHEAMTREKLLEQELLLAQQEEAEAFAGLPQSQR